MISGPFVCVPARTQTHPPKVGRSLSQGSHTKRPFSCRSLWSGRCGWGGGCRAQRSPEESKRPLLLGGRRMKPAGRAAAAPSQRPRVCGRQRPPGETEASCGRAGTRAPDRQVTPRCGSLAVGEKGAAMARGRAEPELWLAWGLRGAARSGSGSVDSAATGSGRSRLSPTLEQNSEQGRRPTVPRPDGLGLGVFLQAAPKSLRAAQPWSWGRER